MKKEQETNPSLVTYQVCRRRCDLSESRRDPSTRGRGTLCQDDYLWNLPLISFGSSDLLEMHHGILLDSWLHFWLPLRMFYDFWWIPLIGLCPRLWKLTDTGVSTLKIHRYRSIYFENPQILEYLSWKSTDTGVSTDFCMLIQTIFNDFGFSLWPKFFPVDLTIFSFGAMSYNFYFISGSRNPASLVQSLQQPAVQEPKPRPTLQLLDRPRPVINPPAGTSPEILPLTEANLAQGLTPAPRPRNMEILQQRATSVQGSVSRHSHKQVSKVRIT